MCALAEALGVRRALVPAQAGVLSALGMTVARPGRQLSRSLRRPLAELDEAAIAAALAGLEAEGARALAAEGLVREALTLRPSLDVCYRGQSFALTLPWTGDCAALAARFAAEHRRRYGHGLDRPLEVVNLRLALDAPGARLPLAPPPADGLAALPAHTPHGVPILAQAALTAGQRIDGPAVVVSAVGTAWVAPGWTALADAGRNLRLDRA